MTSGKLTKKPEDAHREALAKRDRKAQIQQGVKFDKIDQRTPSQKRSEAIRKKMKRRGSK